MNVGRFLLGVPFALACVNGGDDSTAKPQGSLGGPCFANNTCNAGLDCVLQNGSGICEQGDATIADSPTNDVVVDQSNDVSTNDAGDGGAEAEAGCTASPHNACPNFDCHAQSMSCCANTGACGQSTTDCNGPAPWACVKGGDCNTNFPCCLSATIAQPNACPPFAQVSAAAQCGSSNQCGSGTYQLCITNGECPSGTCTAISLSGVNSYVGFCM